MWIYSPERGLFNLDFVSRISADKGGTYLSVNGTTILLCDYDATTQIAEAISAGVKIVGVMNSGR